jgi:hypothetical protein
MSSHVHTQQNTGIIAQELSASWALITEHVPGPHQKGEVNRQVGIILEWGAFKAGWEDICRVVRRGAPRSYHS